MDRRSIFCACWRQCCYICCRILKHVATSAYKHCRSFAVFWQTSHCFARDIQTVPTVIRWYYITRCQLNTKMESYFRWNKIIYSVKRILQVSWNLYSFGNFRSSIWVSSRSLSLIILLGNFINVSRS